MQCNVMRAGCAIFVQVLHNIYCMHIACNRYNMWTLSTMTSYNHNNYIIILLYYIPFIWFSRTIIFNIALLSV